MGDERDWGWWLQLPQAQVVEDEEDGWRGRLAVGGGVVDDEEGMRKEIQRMTQLGGRTGEVS